MARRQVEGRLDVAAWPYTASIVDGGLVAML